MLLVLHLFNFSSPSLLSQYRSIYYHLISQFLPAFEYFKLLLPLMDSKNVGKAREFEEEALDSNVRDNTTTESSAYSRADMIDFKTWDVQLEKHLNRAWPRNTSSRNQPEEWEIDLAKLDIKNAIAHGTYGTVYKAVYDAQDVAGHNSFLFLFLL